MQHVDEGRIQAWIDRERSGIDAAEGEAVERHLAECPACARVAEELERIDSRSAEVLSATRLDDDALPDFDTIRERARRLERTPRRLAAWRAGAWAASLVAAIGLGWAMNDLLGPGTVAGRPGLPAAAIAPEAEMAESPSGVPTAEADRFDAAELVAQRDAAARAEADVSVARPEAATGAESADVVVVLPEVTEPAPAPADAAATPALELARPAAPNVAATVDDLADRALERRVVDRGRTVLGRVVDEEGRPIPAAQVFVEGTAVGALTTPDGAFLLNLASAAVPADDARLVVQHIGHGEEARRLGPWVGDTLAVRFELTELALALEQIVVSGLAASADRPAQPTPAPEPAPAAAAENAARTVGSPAGVPVADVRWTRVSESEAERAAGFPLVRLPELVVEDVDLGSVEGVTVVRVTQAQPDGTRITLLTSRADLLVGPLALPTGHRVAYGSRGDVRIAVTGPVSVGRLLGVLDRVR